MKIFRLAVCLLCAVSTLAGAQTRSAALDNPSRIVLPEDYGDGATLPVVVFLPYTNGDSEEQARAFGFIPGEHRGAIMVLPPGRFSTQDYLPDFLSFVSWYEERLLADLEAMEAEYSIDPARIILAGYSLGGDLAWALSVRNPRLFAGAVVGGSRSSYPAGRGVLQQLVENSFRGAFLIGENDSPQRFDGLNLARSRLEGAGGEVFYREYPGGHVNPPVTLAREALNFTLGGDRDTITSSVRARTGTPATRTPATAARTTSSPLSGRILIHADLPLDVTGRSSTGVALASENRVRISGQTLLSNWWLRGQVGYRAWRPLQMEQEEPFSTVHAIYSEASVAFGPDTLWGAGVEWNWEQWVGGGAAPDGSARDIGQRPVIWVHHVRSGPERFVPRLSVSLGYRIPQTFEDVPPEHMFGFRVDARYQPFSFLRLAAEAGVDSRQARVDPDAPLRELLQNGYFGALAADVSLGPYIRLGVQWRPTLTRAADNSSQSLFENIWRAEFSYVLF